MLLIDSSAKVAGILVTRRNWPTLLSSVLMPELAAWQWALGIACGLFAGIAKTGMPGVAIVIVPLMVLIAGEARSSPAWLLPLLLTGDAFALIYWRRHASRVRLTALMPWVAVGI